MSSDTKLITGFIAGALVGVAAALLLAPAPGSCSGIRAGSETRAVVVSRAGELRRRAAELAQRAGNLRNRADASEEENAESDGELSRSS